MRYGVRPLVAGAFSTTDGLVYRTATGVVAPGVAAPGTWRAMGMPVPGTMEDAMDMIYFFGLFVRTA